MPNWKKLIVSGSDASLNSLNVTNNVTAQSFTGSFSGSFTAPGATTQVVYNNGGVLAANSGFVYSGSNVGIGISAPTEKLHIVSSATGNQFGRITATDSNSSAAWVAQNDSGDNVVYRVFSSGVSGTQMGSALGRSASLLANLGGSGVFLLGTFSNTNFVLGTNNTERMRITTAGDVGIGNTSPNDKLDVSGNVSANAFNAVGTLARYNGTGGVAIAGLGGSSYAYILAYSDSSGTSKNLALQQNGGNVGIGTTAPSQVLEVQGQAQIGNDSVTSAGLFFARKNTNQAKSHYFLSAQESPTYQWIEGGYFTSELAGVSVANNSGKPYYESYSPAGQYKSFGFINQQTSGSSFTSTAVTASVVLYQGGNIALAPTLGNVGIGTTSPTAKLEVIGQGSGSVKMGATGFGGDWVGISLSGNLNTSDYNLLSSATNASFYLNRPTGGDMLFRHNNSDQMIIKSGGNVGIGTTSPSEKLHVEGTTDINILVRTSGASGNAYTTYENSGDNTFAWAIGRHNAGGFYFNSSTGGTYPSGTTTTRMVIDTSGNVGIGTASPVNKFVVSNAGASGLEVDPVGGVSSGVLLQAYNRSTSAYMAQSYYALTHTFNAGSGAGTRVLDITSAGNVGIGTTSPSQKLHVAGTGLFTDVLTFAGDTRYGVSKVYNASTGDMFGMEQVSAAQTGTGAATRIFADDASNNFISLGSYTDATTFVDRLKVNTNNGNVGIGTTNPSYKLEVVGAVSASTYYGDGSNLTNIGSGSVAAAGSDGQLQYNNSGLFGGASRLYYNDSTNRVGIGTSSPGYDLDVSGSVRVQDRLRVGPINTGNGVIHQSSDATINASSSTIVWSVPGSAGICAFIEYYIFNSTTGTSQRAGNIVTTWNSAGTPQITHTETTTPDIGTTALVTFTTSITLGGDPQLVATNTSINPFYIVLNYRYF
jgi:hypothetical protein